MNMRKKLREFFTMTRRAEAGFTLVELIVVIAIVAILGGVAVPAYSGYIEKADRAADAQLLADVNKAFAAACMVKGVDNYNAGANNPTIDENGKIGAITVAGVPNEEFRIAFESFFDNEGEFKKTDTLIYYRAIGGFKDPEADGKTKTFAYGNGFVQVTSDAIQALLNSTFYGEGMTSEKLMEQVNTVAKLAGGMGSIANVMKTEDYVDASLIALGITPKGSLEEKNALLQAKAQELALKKMGLNDMSQITAANKGQFGDILADISNNSLVLYTAQSTSKMDAETAKSMLDGVNSGLIRDAMDGKLTEADKAKGMNQAALAYGMYYAYVNSSACTDPNIKGDSEIMAQEVIDALDTNKEFKDYMTSDQGTKDMECVQLRW